MDNARALIGLAIMVYERLSTMLFKHGNCTRLLKIKNKMKISWFTNKVGKIPQYFVGVFNRMIIPLALVGYEMIIANSVLRASFAIY